MRARCKRMAGSLTSKWSLLPDLSGLSGSSSGETSSSLSGDHHPLPAERIPRHAPGAHQDSQPTLGVPGLESRFVFPRFSRQDQSALLHGVHRRRGAVRERLNDFVSKTVCGLRRLAWSSGAATQYPPPIPPQAGGRLPPRLRGGLGRGVDLAQKNKEMMDSSAHEEENRIRVNLRNLRIKRYPLPHRFLPSGRLMSEDRGKGETARRGPAKKPRNPKRWRMKTG